MKLIRFVVAWVCAAFLACSVHAAPSPNPGWEAVESALAANDPVGARRIAESLAAAGDPDVINGLAVLVGQGVGGVRDEARANELIERAANADSIAAKVNLARSLSMGDSKHFPRALGLLQDAKKDPRFGKASYYPLGRILLFGGRGVDDLKQGVAYMKQAAEFEPRNADAHFLVGRSYQNGWGGSERNPAKAFQSFLAASKLGDDRAQRFVGMARLEGIGTAKDPLAALADFKAAAGQGNVWATLDIGVVLATGEGVPAKPDEARKWYERAARLGSAHGLRSLGVMIGQGDGGPQDTLTGRAYIELAAEAGDANARRIGAKLPQHVAAPTCHAIDRIKADWRSPNRPPKAG